MVFGGFNHVKIGGFDFFSKFDVRLVQVSYIQVLNWLILQVCNYNVQLKLEIIEFP